METQIARRSSHVPRGTPALVSAAVVGVLALAVAGCVPFLARDAGPSLLDVVGAAGGAPTRVDSIWPGYSLREQGFLVYEPGRPALLGAWTQVAVESVPARGTRTWAAVLPLGIRRWR